MAVRYPIVHTESISLISYLEQRQNENPSPVEYEMVRFGDRISVHVPSASFASTTQRFKARLFDT